MTYWLRHLLNANDAIFPQRVFVNWSFGGGMAGASLGECGSVHIDIKTQYFERLLELSRCFSLSHANSISVSSALDWMKLHEIQHTDLGHFELLDGTRTLQLIARSGQTSKPINTLPREIWHLTSPCIEMQADHEAIDLLLGEYGISDSSDIRTKAASIAAVMVLIEQEDAKNKIEHSTHPKAATRIFQLLGHISEMWSHPAHEIARDSGRNHVDEQHLPPDDDIIAFGKDVILPAYWDAVALAEAAHAKTIIDDLGSSEDFFADIRHAKLGQWDKLKTVGAKEWATLKETNSKVLAAMGY